MKINIREKFGNKIKRLRAKRGYTQEKLSELSEVDYKYLQKIEGKTPPNVKLETIERIAKALKASPADLLKD